MCSLGVVDCVFVWLFDGQMIVWFFDDGDGYEILFVDQDGFGELWSFDIGELKMVWEVVWLLDGDCIVFVDDDVCVCIFELESGDVMMVDIGGINMECGNMGFIWLFDGQYFVYVKIFFNFLCRVVVWFVVDGMVCVVIDLMVDVILLEWDWGGKYFYLFVSIDVVLCFGWVNMSIIWVLSLMYVVYVVLLLVDLGILFEFESDEELVKEELLVEEEDEVFKDGYVGKKGKGKKVDKEFVEEFVEDDEGKDDDGLELVEIDFDGIECCIVVLFFDVVCYCGMFLGFVGFVFILELWEGGLLGFVLYKFDFKECEVSEFLSGVWGVNIFNDGQKMFVCQGLSWLVVGIGGLLKFGDGGFNFNLQMKFDCFVEWEQIFDEVWCYQCDFFYDFDFYGCDWNVVCQCYELLLLYVKYCSDLNYVFDQMNGEFFVGYSFVFGGDMFDMDDFVVGLFGVDFIVDGGCWKIECIYIYESWNFSVQVLFDVFGFGVEEGYYFVGVNGVELMVDEDFYEFFDGMVG